MKSESLSIEWPPAPRRHKDITPPNFKDDDFRGTLVVLMKAI